MNRKVEGNIYPAGCGNICEGVIEGTISSADMPCIDGILARQGYIQGTITYPNGTEYRDYNILINKPQIETVELIGNKTFEELGLSSLTYTQIDRILT